MLRIYDICYSNYFLEGISFASAPNLLLTNLFCKTYFFYPFKTHICVILNSQSVGPSIMMTLTGDLTSISLHLHFQFDIFSV